MTPVEPLVYSVEEAAAALGIGRSLAFELVRRGELPTVRLGRRRVIPRQLLADWLESQFRASMDSMTDTHLATGPAPGPTPPRGSGDA